jgi:hypothetical protein
MAMKRALPLLRAGCRRFLALAALLLLVGCQSLYFRPAGPPPDEAVSHPLAKLPFSEYWTGIVFNGEKIGFTHFLVRPVPNEEKRFEIRTEASFALRFLGIEKKINLRAHDLVDDGLSLLEFDYDYRIDGSALLQKGRRDGDMLHVSTVTGGKASRREFPVEDELYPSSVIALYPVLHGMRLGREYRYRVYDGQTQTVAEVEQRVAGYETSDFFTGPAFKIFTTLHGQRTTTWIGHDGRPQFELALRGVMISALEDEHRAKRYLALAALNKQEALLDFSLVKPEAPVRDPRHVARMSVALEGLNSTPPASELQRCSRVADGYACEIRAALDTGGGNSSNPVPDKYLAPSITVQSNDPNVRILAREIAPPQASAVEKARRIVQWMERNIERAPIDVFSALDVLEKRRAECQGHAYLYTALARALGIPTRVVNGLAYSEQFEGFLFHSWAESLLEGRWRPVDPTFGQEIADATHIKLLEGETLADLLPLIDWVGRLRIRVLEVEHRRH